LFKPIELSPRKIHYVSVYDLNIYGLPQDEARDNSSSEEDQEEEDKEEEEQKANELKTSDEDLDISDWEYGDYNNCNFKQQQSVQSTDTVETWTDFERAQNIIQTELAEIDNSIEVEINSLMTNATEELHGATQIEMESDVIITQPSQNNNNEVDVNINVTTASELDVGSADDHIVIKPISFKRSTQEITLLKNILLSYWRPRTETKLCMGIVNQRLLVKANSTKGKWLFYFWFGDKQHW
jgi:hypothetical protein